MITEKFFLQPTWFILKEQTRHISRLLFERQIGLNFLYNRILTSSYIPSSGNILFLGIHHLLLEFF